MFHKYVEYLCKEVKFAPTTLFGFPVGRHRYQKRERGYQLEESIVL